MLRTASNSSPLAFRTGSGGPWRLAASQLETPDSGRKPFSAPDSLRNHNLPIFANYFGLTFLTLHWSYRIFSRLLTVHLQFFMFVIVPTSMLALPRIQVDRPRQERPIRDIRGFSEQAWIEGLTKRCYRPFDQIVSSLRTQRQARHFHCSAVLAKAVLVKRDVCSQNSEGKRQSALSEDFPRASSDKTCDTERSTISEATWRQVALKT